MRCVMSRQYKVLRIDSPRHAGGAQATAGHLRWEGLNWFLRVAAYWRTLQRVASIAPPFTRDCGTMVVLRPYYGLYLAWSVVLCVPNIN